MEEELEDEDAEGDTVEEQDRSQDRDPHFVRACAVEMHMDMSEEPFFAFYAFYARIYRKNAAPEGLGARFVPACTSDMHMDMSDELCYARMPVRRTFCAILRNRKAHGHVTRAHLCKFRGEREKSLHCTTAKSIAHRSPHRAEDDKGVW